MSLRHACLALALSASPLLAQGPSTRLTVAGGAGASRDVQPRGMDIELVSNGFGLLLPYRAFVADANGLPTSTIIELRTHEDLFANVSAFNPILPTTELPSQALLPGGAPGNHFLYATFTQNLDPASVLDSAASAASVSNLLGTLTVLARDPVTGLTVPVQGRAFINGFTYGAPDPANPGHLRFEKWVALDSSGNPVARTIGGQQPGLGFPGTEQSFLGAGTLVGRDTFVFVADTDGDLSTHETFPAGVTLAMDLTAGITSRHGAPLEHVGRATTTIGLDRLEPAVQTLAGAPVIVPGNGDVGVDPATTIEVRFTEAIAAWELGPWDDGSPPGFGSGFLLAFGPATQRAHVPINLRPVSIYDLSRLEFVPAYPFPGSGPSTGGLSCGDFSQIDVTLLANGFADLAQNRNTSSVSTFFVTGPGPGLVNAPVTPDAIYLARGGSSPAVSVLDLNGFGAGTGDPTYDVTNPAAPGNSNYPNNPNVSLQGALLIPALAPGTCTLQGGSAGVFSLTLDSNLQDELVGAPLLDSVGDMALGQALDTTFNNGLPFGCQSGGGNLCATTGLKLLKLSQGGATTLQPQQPGQLLLKQAVGTQNLVSWAPHPNPPPLVFPPLCLAPGIGGQEPTAFDASQAPLGLVNLLVPGDPFGNPGLGIPPSGLLTAEQNAFFQGPSRPQPSIASCSTYMVRQQVGQFLYVADRVAGELVVLDSNRFRVLDRIAVPDPTSLAMSPNLDLLAVSSAASDSVVFVDVDPVSSTFHEVVKTTPVGRGPQGIAWEPGNEDILVCNELDDSVSILSAFDLEVRKVVTAHLSGPFEVALTPRQLGFGWQRGVYWGYVLNRDGTVALFESGPAGPNGWGYDDVVGAIPFPFANPRALQADVTSLSSAVWIAHEEPLDPSGVPTGQPGAALTRVELVSAVTGLLPLTNSTPQLRQLSFTVGASLGTPTLTGVPVDLAFDDLRNLGGLTNRASAFSAGSPRSINGKALVKDLAGIALPASAPRFLLAAVPASTQGPGVVDVIDLASLQRLDTDAAQPGVQSVPAPGVTGLAHFFRQ